MTRRGWVLFALMSVIWGIPYLMIKVAVADVSVPVLVFARTTLGAMVLLPLAIRAGGLPGILRRYWLPIIAFAAFEIAIPWWLLSDAERRLSSSMSGLLIAAVPIIAAVLARATGDTERLGARRVIGLGVGFGGVAVLAAPHLDGGDALSVLEALGTALGYAVAPLIAARKLKDVPNEAVTGTALTLAALVYLPSAVLTWPQHVPPAKVLASLAGLGLICTALAFVIFLQLIGEVGPSRAMVFTYINPAVAVAAGVLILGEDLTLPIVAAFGLIIAGSVLATGSRAQPRLAPDHDTDASMLSPRG